MFNIDFNGHCSECHMNDGAGTLATVGSQLHLLVFVGLWVYSFIHREVFIWIINGAASILLAICHVFHKVDILGDQPPCLGCIVAMHDRFYDLEGSAVPCAPVALLSYYVIFIYMCPLELGSACTYNGGGGGGKSTIDSLEEEEWDRVRHLDVLIIPCWAGTARLYIGLTTPSGVVTGVILGGVSALCTLSFLRSQILKTIVRYLINGEAPAMCGGGSCCSNIGSFCSYILKFVGFETRFLDILWHNLEVAENNRARRGVDARHTCTTTSKSYRNGTTVAGCWSR